jgi:hypothetical protein
MGCCSNRVLTIHIPHEPCNINNIYISNRDIRINTKDVNKTYIPDIYNRLVQCGYDKYVYHANELSSNNITIMYHNNRIAMNILTECAKAVYIPLSLMEACKSDLESRKTYKCKYHIH